jgi:hypothetical protein
MRLRAPLFSNEQISLLLAATSGWEIERKSAGFFSRLDRVQV